MKPLSVIAQPGSKDRPSSAAPRRPRPRRTGLAAGVLGAPGVGKGTQAELLRDQLGACPLSTGDVFRAAKTIPEAERARP